MRLTGRYTRAMRALWLCTLLACAGAAGAVDKVKPGEVPTLEADEGFLIAAVDSPWPLASVRLGQRDRAFGGVPLPGISQGGGLMLLVVPAGRYQWQRLQPSYQSYFQLAKDREYEFVVKAGQLNYPGDLVFRPSGEGRAHFHIANRGLRALDWMRKHHPKVLAEHRFEFMGRFPDPFPAHYATARAASATKDEDLDNIIAAPAAGTLPLAVEPLWRRGRVSELRLDPAGELLAEAIVVNDKWSVEIVDLAAGAVEQVLKPSHLVEDMDWLGSRTLLVTLHTPRGQHEVVAIHVGNAGGKRTYDVVPVPFSGTVLRTIAGDDRHVLFQSHTAQGTAMVHRVDLSSDAAMRASPRTFQARINKMVEGGYAWIPDRQGRIRLVLARDEDTSALWYGQGDQFVRIMDLDDDDAGFQPMLLSADGALIYGVSEEGRGQREAVVFDPATRAITKTLFSKPGVDVDRILLDSDGVPIGVSYQQGGLHVSEYFDAAHSTANASLQAAFPGRNIHVLDRDAAGQRFVLGVDGSAQPMQFYFYDRALRKVELVDESRPWLGKQPLATGQVLEARGSDGLPIEAFLTMPRQVTGKVPMVVLAHGGPVGVADRLSFDPEVQFLASLGYAVLQVNFRGSHGYGTAHRKAGWAGFGTLIEEDIHAAVDVALAAHPIDAGRMCAMGSSYGGYSSLVSAIRWPERYKCVVTIAGVSDRPLLFTASDLAGSDQARKELVESLGDPHTQLAAMMATSPLYRAADLRAAVMIVHGTEDERVDFEHARRLVRALNLVGRPPVVIPLVDEGHGVHSAENRARVWPAIAAFLAQHLGGAGASPPTAPAASSLPATGEGAKPAAPAGG